MERLSYLVDAFRSKRVLFLVILLFPLLVLAYTLPDGTNVNTLNVTALNAGTIEASDDITVTEDILPNVNNGSNLGDTSTAFQIGYFLTTKYYSALVSKGQINAAITTPSGASTTGFRSENVSGNNASLSSVSTSNAFASGGVYIESGNQSHASAHNSGPINIQSGTANGGNSGPINLQAGLSTSGTRGNVTVDAPALVIESAQALRLEDSSGGEYMGFKAPSTVTSSVTFTLPNGDGTAGQSLGTNGSGTLYWKIAAPTVQKFTSGSGTYTTPANVRWVRIRMVGGGGGGAGSGTASSSSNGAAGGNTTFGTSLLTANGGNGGNWAGSPAAGGSVTINSPAINIASVAGGYSVSGQFQGINTVQLTGGSGGVSVFGGAGSSTYGGGAGIAAQTNSGSGGGGGGSGPTAAIFSGPGGGAGGYIEAIISGPSASYSYAIGAAGSAGAAGTSGYAGGAGAAGVIIVEEHY